MGPAKDFLELFMVEAFISDALTADILRSILNFIHRVIQHEDIPNNSPFKGKTILILIFLFKPLSGIFQTITDRDSEIQVPDGFRSCVKQCLDAVLQVAPVGLELVPICLKVADVLTSTFEEHHSVLSTQHINMMNLYPYMLSFDVSMH